MTYATKILVVLTAFAVLSFIIPTDAVAEYEDPQETDVAIAREYWYQIDNSKFSSGGSSERSPTYHNLFVTPTDTEVTFHNYVNVHDERVQSTKYFIEWRINVYEDFDGELTFVDSEYTGSVTYSPPNELSHYQSITIDVEYSGIGSHLFHVGSEFKWHKVNSDGSLEYFETTEYSQSAFVHEVLDLSGDYVETSAL